MAKPAPQPQAQRKPVPQPDKTMLMVWVEDVLVALMLAKNERGLLLALDDATKIRVPETAIEVIRTSPPNLQEASACLREAM